MSDFREMLFSETIQPLNWQELQAKDEELQKELDNEQNAQLPPTDEIDHLIEEEINNIAEEIAEGNPLYNSVNLTLKKEYAVLDSVEIFEQNLTEKHEDIISEISYSKAHFLTINETLYNGLWYALGFCSILIIIAVVLINNTIRLAIFSKRFLIRTMQFVGAKHSFIQKPFLLNSITQGILSALLAILIYIVMSLFLENYNSYIGELVFKPENMNTNLIMFAIITGIGVLVSFGSTFFSMKKYLKLSQDELYKR